VGVGAQGVQTESEQIRMADNFRRDRSRGPIAELARLISQVHGERAHADSDFGEETASIGYDNRPGFRLRPSCRSI
jgi:hypothetical protein